MRLKIGFVMLLMGLFSASQAFAGSPGRLGTAGAQELRIPVGSRATAMGGAVIADVSGTEALFWNPAGVANVQGSEVAFSYLTYIADIKLNYFGFTTNLGNFGSVGASAKILDIGDIVMTTEEYPEGTGTTYSPNIFVLGLTYSRRMTDMVCFGTTMTYIYEEIMRQTASGVAFDFGFQYSSGLKGLRFGVVMKNYGPNMRFDGADFEYFMRPTEDDPQAVNKTMRLVSAPFELPSFIQFGTSYDVVSMANSKVTISGNFQGNSFTDDEYRGSVEYCFGEMFSLRGGYVYSVQSDYLYGATFGAGVNLNIGGSKLAFDYCYATVTEFFDNNQFFTVKLNF